MMASELAHPGVAHPAVSQDTLMTNGDHEATATVNDGPNTGAFEENAALPKSEPVIDTSDKHIPDPHPAGPTPTEDVAPGITPVTSFIPKDAPASHPTPPPDEPLEPSNPNIDTQMSNTDEAPELPTEQLVVPTESTLVRPRENDVEDEEPAAKRSRVESPVDADVPMTDVPTAAPVASAELSNGEQLLGGNDRVASEPSNLVGKPALATASQPTDVGVAPIDGQAPAASADPADTTAVNGTAKATAEAQPSQPLSVPAQKPEAPGASPKHSYSKEPMTVLQTKFLLEKMKNLKKTKHSLSFLNPVDPVALGIPTYVDIVKSPMDLSTMERNLKDGKYKSVQEFGDDFDLIIHNTRLFNGDNHVVTQAGYSMEAYFRKMMESVPSSDQQLPSKVQKRPSPGPKPTAPARRESRSANVVAQPAVPARVGGQASGDTYALQPDGTPQIRRDSSINRPTRTIKPPPNRELTYAKPKRKEHQLELRFCKYVLDQIRAPQYAHQNSVFLAPVDPVALNIPNYRQIVKSPMDLSTMAQKLTSGQYGKAAEFKKDFDLMIANCLAFNPAGNPVRDMGIGFQRAFNQLWADKDQWEAAQRGETTHAMSASGDDDSGDDDADDDEEEDEAKNATIRALQKQLSDLQNTIAGLNQPTKGKKNKKAGVKATTKKSGSASAPKPKLAAKPKPKKAKQVTYDEKQEISDAVSRMNEDQIGAITTIITSNCSKYANQNDMELEIDDLPPHVQVMLLEYVRREFGNPIKRARAASPDDLAAMDDDDFEPAERGARRGGSKRKKHKPMGKKEQQEKIDGIQKQLAQFQQSASRSESPQFAAANNQNADTSGDEESDESEEE